MPNVTLIDFTGRGTPNQQWYAANILIFTKSTRLTLSPAAFADIEQGPVAEKEALLKDMAKTIPSSWEFVDATFLIEGVTRACAQQITRTRNASYSMQSQRVVDASEAEIVNPFEPCTETCKTFEAYSEIAMTGYSRLLRLGAQPQDARGLLPMNIQCNLLAKYNLRAFVDLVHSRASLRTQGEYADVVKQEVAALIEVWPWVSSFLESPYDIAIKELEEIAREAGITPGRGIGWRVAKAIDLLRKT